MVASSLEGVAGLGPQRRERLMLEFGSLDALRQATLADLEVLEWLPKRWRGTSTIIYRRPVSLDPRRGVQAMSEVVLVTGMSGAGRSTVSAALEDLGWFVIDNLPVELIVRVGELAAAGSFDYAGVAFVVGRSGRVQPTRCSRSRWSYNKCTRTRRSSSSTRRRRAHPPLRSKSSAPPVPRAILGGLDCG